MSYRQPTRSISRGACGRSAAVDVSAPISKWSPTPSPQPTAALVLEYIIQYGKPKTIVFSTFGVREGLYEMLPPQERAKDGFICAAQTLNGLLSRSARHAEELVAWTDRLVRVVKLRETAEDRRHAACCCPILSAGAGVRPPRRGNVSLITNEPFGCDQPPGPRLCRAVGVLPLRRPQRGKRTAEQANRELVPPAMDERARILGAAFRVGADLGGAYRRVAREDAAAAAS